MSSVGSWVRSMAHAYLQTDAKFLAEHKTAVLTVTGASLVAAAVAYEMKRPVGPPVPETWDAHVKPHSKLERIAPRIWMAKGCAMGFELFRNMVVYKMPDGGLLVHSAVAMNDEEQSKLDALGPVKIIIVPNGMHRLDAAVYRQRYPGAHVLCPQAAVSRVQEVVAVDATCEDYFAANAVGVTCHALPFKRWHELVYEVEIGETQRALIFSDALFNVDAAWVPRQPLPLRLMIRLAGVVTRDNVPRASHGYTLFSHDGHVYRDFLVRLAERIEKSRRGGVDYVVLTVAHGDPVTGDLAAKLRTAAQQL